MIRTLALTGPALALLALAAPAQTPTVTHYGTPCPAGAQTLNTQGTPRLGSTFTVTGISLLMGCTQRACICNCCLCNRCSGPAFLLMGAGRSNVPVALPGLIGDGCPILVTQDAVLVGNQQGNVDLPIPNSARLAGLQFNLQSVNTLWQTTAGSQCTTTTFQLNGVNLSDGVECVIGV